MQGPLEVGVHITEPARLPGLRSAIYSAAKQVIEEDLCNAWMASRLVRRCRLWWQPIKCEP